MNNPLFLKIGLCNPILTNSGEEVFEIGFRERFRVRDGCDNKQEKGAPDRDGPPGSPANSEITLYSLNDPFHLIVDL